MVIQDILNGHGVCFIDPHGDSVAKILDFVPSSRVNDVIYFNPADLDHPIAFNILEAVDTRYKHLVASGLMGVFTKLWANMWSSRMEYILNNTILALLESPGNTMLGIVRMYVDKKYRKKIVDNIKDPMVRAFWVDEFANYAEKYRTEAVAPIQNKVGQFLSSGVIRNIVGQPRSTIDLRSIMDNKKILLLDLSKGKVGEDNSALLGAMIITKLQLAALSRVDIPEEQRLDFYLYVDEFQNFVTESFATILSEARKYRLNLIMGHQYIGQLAPDRNNTKVRDAVFGNVGTMVVFRVGAADAEFLETEFDPTYTPTDIVNLPKYNIILKLMINGVSSDPFSAITMPVNESWRTGNAEKVIKVSRERYGNTVAEVEEKISRWMGAEFHEQQAVLIGSESPQVADQTEFGETESVSIIAEEPKPKLKESYAPEPAPAIQPVAADEPFVLESTDFILNEQTPEAVAVSPEPARAVVEKVEKAFIEVPIERAPRPQQSHGQGQRATHGHKSGQQQRHGGETQQRDHRSGNQGQGSAHGPKKFDRHAKQKKDKKHENPIWDTVRTIDQTKTKDLLKKVETAVSQVHVAPPSQSKALEPSQPPHQDASPHVLKPGEVKSF
jgi:hypothetical protein